MKKPLILAATLAALAGCTSGGSTSKNAVGSQSGSQSVAAQPSEQTPTTPSTSQLASDMPTPEFPAHRDAGSAANDDGHLQSQSDTAAGPGWSSSSTASSGSASDIQVGSDDSSATIPDRKSDDQRGSVLTNDGAVKPSAKNGASAGSAGGSQPGSIPSTSIDADHGSLQGSAESDATRSLHVPTDEAVDNSGATSDTSKVPSSVSDRAVTDDATLGETDADRQLAQRIRLAVVDDETLSLGAKSVQVESNGGQIVLKGTVASEREKARIGSAAFRESGGKAVINQLEVTGR